MFPYALATVLLVLTISVGIALIKRQKSLSGPSNENALASKHPEFKNFNRRSRIR